MKTDRLLNYRVIRICNKAIVIFTTNRDISRKIWKEGSCRTEVDINYYNETIKIMNELFDKDPDIFDRRYNKKVHFFMDEEAQYQGLSDIIMCAYLNKRESHIMDDHVTPVKVAMYVDTMYAFHLYKNNSLTSQVFNDDMLPRDDFTFDQFMWTLKRVADVNIEIINSPRPILFAVGHHEKPYSDWYYSFDQYGKYSLYQVIAPVEGVTPIQMATIGGSTYYVKTKSTNSTRTYSGNSTFVSELPWGVKVGV